MGRKLLLDKANIEGIRYFDAYRKNGGYAAVEKAFKDIPACSLAHVEATYLAWIDCSGLGLENPAEHFLKHGVALSPGSQFGAPRFVRLNFGTQRSRLLEALKRISGSLKTSSTRSPKG